MKGVEVDFDAIEIGERQSDVKSKQSNKRVNLGDAPKDTQAEYVPAGQRGEDGDIEEFIKLDIGEGQEFEALNYNHKLRRKLRRAMDNAQIRKEMLVRQRALDYYQEQDKEPPAILKTPYKAVNVKGQRILDNGMFETAKQERVRARMELAEFNTQMRILRKQAKDAAIYAGLRKHAELTGRVSPSETPITNEDVGAGQQNDSNQLLSSSENPLKTTGYGDDRLSRKRIRSGSDDSTSSSSDDPSDKGVEASSLSDDISENSSENSASEGGPQKRQMLQNGRSNNVNKQTESTNSDRQAMIDAESARKLPNGSGSLQEVSVNGDRKFQRKGIARGANAVSNWNVNGLPGDKARKSKFLRLLGGEGSGLEGRVENDVQGGDPGARMNAELEKQYEYGMAHKKDSKREGLSS